MRFFDLFRRRNVSAKVGEVLDKEPIVPGDTTKNRDERGSRPTPENQLKYIHSYLWCDPEHRAKVMDIRLMDRDDGRVKKIHGRMARTGTKGGLVLDTSSNNKRIINAWAEFERRVGLHKQSKLESDCRGLVMEGNLPYQWVLGPDSQITAGVRMPSETIKPLVGANGTFDDPMAAYEQYDLSIGQPIAKFPLWKLTMGRLDPQNYDDWGCMGRPYLDANRETWRKLRMTETDLVVRRHTRAPLRHVHILKNPTEGGMKEYESKVMNDQNEVTTDFFIEGEGDVKSLQGDANLSLIHI